MMLVLESVCAGLAVLLVVYASCGALFARTALARLHFLAPVTSLALPLVALAAIIAFGVSLGSATVLAIALVGSLSGPAVTAAVGRAIAAEAGHDVGRSPE